MNARFVTSLSLKHYMILFYSLLFEIPYMNAPFPTPIPKALMILYMNAPFVTPIPKALMLFILSTTLPHDYMNARLAPPITGAVNPSFSHIGYEFLWSILNFLMWILYETCSVSYDAFENHFAASPYFML